MLGGWLGKMRLNDLGSQKLESQICWRWAKHASYIPTYSNVYQQCAQILVVERTVDSSGISAEETLLSAPLANHRGNARVKNKESNHKQKSDTLLLTHVMTVKDEFYKDGAKKERKSVEWNETADFSGTGWNKQSCILNHAGLKRERIQWLWILIRSIPWWLNGRDINGGQKSRKWRKYLICLGSLQRGPYFLSPWQPTVSMQEWSTINLIAILWLKTS